MACAVTPGAVEATGPEAALAGPDKPEREETVTMVATAAATPRFRRRRSTFPPVDLVPVTVVPARGKRRCRPVEGVGVGVASEHGVETGDAGDLVGVDSEDEAGRHRRLGGRREPF